MFGPDSLTATWDSIVITVIVFLVVAGTPLAWWFLRDTSPDRDSPGDRSHLRKLRSTSSMM